MVIKELLILEWYRYNFFLEKYNIILFKKYKL